MVTIQDFDDVRRAFELLGRGLELRVAPAPKPKPDTVIVFAQLNGAGKAELAVQGPTGAAAILYTEP